MNNWEVVKEEPYINIWQVVKEEPYKKSSFLQNITKPFKAQALKTAEALNVGLASFSQNLDDLSQYVGGKLGIADRSGVFEKASKFYLNNAKYLNEKAKEIGTNKVDEIVGEAVGGAVPGISEFMLGPSYYALSGAKEAFKRGDSEVIGAVTEGVQRYVMGKVLHATGILKQPLRSPVMGGVFAATTPEGERAKAFGVGALYGITGPKASGQVGIREIREGLKKEPKVTPIKAAFVPIKEEPLTESDVIKLQGRRPIEPTEYVNKITTEEAGKMIREGKPEVVEHIKEGIEAGIPRPTMQDAIRSQMMKEVADTPKSERPKVVENIKKVEPKINEALKASPKDVFDKIAEPIKTETFLQPTEPKIAKPKPTQPDLIGAVEGLQGKLPSAEVPITPLEEATKKAEERKFIEEKQIGIPEVKEPWQMTKNEYLSDTANNIKNIKNEWLDIKKQRIPIKPNEPSYGLLSRTRRGEDIGYKQRISDAEKFAKETAPTYHKIFIQQALSEGKPVPSEVLKDYLDLMPKKEPKPSQPTNIITWIKSKGGIDYIKEEWGGEIDTAIENQPTLKSAVNMKGGGRTLDDLATSAYAEGWIPEASRQSLLDAVEGKKIRPSLMEERIARKGPGAIMAGGIAFESNLPKYAININLDRIDNTYAIKKTILDISDKYAQEIGEARRGKISLEETRNMADTLGMSEKKLLKRRQGKAFNAEEALAARDILNASAQRLRDTQIKAAQLGTEEALGTFRMALEHHAAIQAQVSGMTAEAGRALSSFRIMSKARESKAYKSMLDAMGGRELNEEILRKFAQIDPTNTTAVNVFIQKVTKAKTSDMVYEAWISAILSGPKTHAVNLTSNALTFLTKPLLEDPIAATLEVARGIVTGKTKERYFREIPYQVFGMWNGFKEGVRAAVKAWQTEMPSEIGEKIELTVRQAIPSKTVKLFGKEFEIGGKQIRIPLRALTAADEFGKAVIYRSEINSQAYRTARKEGLKGDKLVNRITELQQDPTPNMIESARKEARYRTFNQPLGNIGNLAMRLRNSNMLFKFIVPFMRTPANIAKFALERTPLNFARLAYKVSKGEIPETQLSEEFAKPIMGSLIAAAVVAWAKEGFITGAGPKDKEDREALYRIGWQPYSFKIGDKYWSYARLEPIGSVVGMSADFAETFNTKMSEKEQKEIVSKIVYSFGRNITSKTFLSGVSNAMDAISDPQRYGEQWINQFVGSAVPTIVAQYTQTQDEALRKAETPVEKIKSRIPGMAETLLPRRDIWGNKIAKEGTFVEKFVSPMAVSTVKTDFIDNEIVRLKLSIGMPAKKISGVELTPEEYDEYSEKAGKRARQLVERTMKTPSYHIQRDEIKKLRIENAIKTARIAESSKMLKTMERERRQKPIKEKYGLK
jgi:hypothetical protein